MVSRAYSGKDAPGELLSALSKAWDLAARASRLEGEVASLTSKLDALERRGRALRAEIGRKVEDLAHDESRVLREAAAHAEDVARADQELAALARAAQNAQEAADAARSSGASNPEVHENLGGARATLKAKQEELVRYKSRQRTCENTAQGLRSQIEQLRSQLSRYAEALEEDLTRGRKQVSKRTAEGLEFEKAFASVCNKLLDDLRDKPECRDLVSEVLENRWGRAPESQESVSRRGPDSTRAREARRDQYA